MYRFALFLVCLLIGLMFVPSAFAGAGKPENIGGNQKLPTVAIISTGGTIAEKIDPATKAAVPAVSGSDLIKAVPGLIKIANLRVVNFCNIDSSQMTPEIWAKLSRKVDEILKDPKVAGAVITHGTDTMAEGAFFLDITLKTNKPVVFVGAMRNASELSPDGPPNLLNAVTQVCSPAARNWGVTVTMNQYVNSARYVRKTQTTNLQTFQSGEKGYLGYIVGETVFKINDRSYKLKLPIPEKLARVDLIPACAGSDGSLIRAAVKLGAKGLVIEGVGAGNVNAKVFKAIKYAISKNVAVVITSDVLNGPVLPLYGDAGGGEQLQKAGAVLGGSLPSRKTRLLLMLALPNLKDLSELKKYFNSISGEEQ